MKTSENSGPMTPAKQAILFSLVLYFRENDNYVSAQALCEHMKALAQNKRLPLFWRKKKGPGVSTAYAALKGMVAMSLVESTHVRVQNKHGRFVNEERFRPAINGMKYSDSSEEYLRKASQDGKENLESISTEKTGIPERPLRNIIDLLKSKGVGPSKRVQNQFLDIVREGGRFRFSVDDSVVLAFDFALGFGKENIETSYSEDLAKLVNKGAIAAKDLKALKPPFPKYIFDRIKKLRLSEGISSENSKFYIANFDKHAVLSDLGRKWKFQLGYTTFGWNNQWENSLDDSSTNSRDYFLPYTPGKLRFQFESCLWNMVVVSLLPISGDKDILFLKRNPETVHYYKNHISFVEESMDSIMKDRRGHFVFEEKDFFDTSKRALRQELGIPEDEFRPEWIRFFAVTREWTNLNVNLVGAAYLPYSTADLHNMMNEAEDKGEFVYFDEETEKKMRVHIDRQDSSSLDECIDALTNRFVNNLNKCGPNCTEEHYHPTARQRLLFAMLHEFGQKAVIEALSKK